MKLPELTEVTKRWDMYKAFHWNRGDFVIFDTGEVIFTKSQPVGGRSHYPELNVQIVATADRYCPALTTPDGREVKKAWLDDNGMQYLMIDQDSRRAVRLNVTPSAARKLGPGRFHKERVYGYFPGPGLPPEGAAPVAVTVPLSNKEWSTPEERETITDKLCAWRAEMVLTGIEGPNKWSYSKVDTALVLVCDSWRNLPALQQQGVLRWELATRKFTFDYLLVAP